MGTSFTPDNNLVIIHQRFKETCVKLTNCYFIFSAGEQSFNFWSHNRIVFSKWILSFGFKLCRRFSSNCMEQCCFKKKRNQRMVERTKHCVEWPDTQCVFSLFLKLFYIIFLKFCSYYWTPNTFTKIFCCNHCVRGWVVTLRINPKCWMENLECVVSIKREMKFTNFVQILKNKLGCSYHILFCSWNI
ncbi:hypothetical protein D3C85_1387510 [compost metagenome]